MGRMSGLLAGLALGSGLCLLAPIAVAADAARNCDQGRRDLEQARQRISTLERDAAISLLNQSITACPSYDAYRLLGEQAGKSSSRADKMAAVDAFVAAQELARTPQDEAAVLFQYASLLEREGDPSNAYPLVNRASQLDSQNASIRQLEKTLAERVRNPQSADIVRGLKDSLYKPLRIAQRETPGGSSDVRPASKAAPPPASGPSVAIPIHFKTDSIELEPEFSRNLATLVSALKDPQLQGRRFVFIGHADARGVAAYNLDLSRRRAEAIHQELVRLEPSLKGRISVEGRGSAEPIDARASEDAYRTNRRLQILLK